MLAAPLRGVNLGGFLILEPYLKPSLFSDVCTSTNGTACPIDEHGLCEALGPAEARRAMHDHWESWVTYDELVTLRHAGINALRIPVGYWIVAPRPGEPFVEGGIAYLLRVCGWAKQLGIRVLVELHAAPGRQNNMDHSGWKDHMGWQVSACAGQHSRLQSEYAARTVSVLHQLLSVLQEHGFVEACASQEDGAGGPCGTVFGLGLVNEPVSFDKARPVDHAGLLELYHAALAMLPSEIFAVIDMFEGFEWLVDGGVLEQPPGRERRLAFDKHRYVGFSEKGMRGALDEPWLERFACAAMSDGFDLCNASVVAARRGETMAPLMFGEWSVAINDCMHWLGGAYNLHTNYECCGVGRCDTTPAARSPHTWTAEEVELRLRYASRQMDAMEQRGSMGWFYWNFKTEPASEWSYLDGLRYGFVPADAAARADNVSGTRCAAGASLPQFCTATDPGCDLCLARNGHNQTCKPFPPAPPPLPSTSCTAATEAAADSGALASETLLVPSPHPSHSVPVALIVAALAVGFFVGGLARRRRRRVSERTSADATPYVALSD